MADTRKGLYLEPDWIPALLAFAPSELGRLIRCALTYITTGTEADLPGKERVLWPYIRSQIDQSNSNILYTLSNTTSLPGYTVSDSSLISCKEKDKEDSKEKEAKKKKEEEKKKTDAFDDFAEKNSQVPGLLQALREFEQMRNRIKKPLTEEAKRRLVGKLTMFNVECWVPILNQSVDHCWQDVYELKGQQAPAKKKQYTTASEYHPPQKIDVSALERIKADFGLYGGA